MTFECRVEPDGFAGVADWWDSAVAASAHPSPFATLAWLTSWWEEYGSGRLIVVSLTEGGEPVGGAAFYLRRRRLRGLVPMKELRLVGDEDVGSEGLDLFAPAGREAEAAAALRDHFQAAWPGADIVHLDGVREGATLLRDDCLPSGARGWQTVMSVCPYLRLNQGAPAAPHSRKLAKQLRRSARSLEAAGYRFARCETSEEVVRALDGLFEHHQARWRGRGEAGAFAHTRKRDFYRKAAGRLLAAGSLGLYVFWQEGLARAVIFGASAGERYFYLQSGFDEAMAKFSPGALILSRTIADVEARGARTFDLMKGSEPYKYQWAHGESRLMHRRGPGRTILGTTALWLGSLAGRPPEPQLRAVFGEAPDEGNP